MRLQVRRTGSVSPERTFSVTAMTVREMTVFAQSIFD